MNVTVEEVNRNVSAMRSEIATEIGRVHQKIDSLDGRVGQLELSRAEMRGGIKMLTWLVGIGLAGPAAIISWLALTGQLGA